MKDLKQRGILLIECPDQKGLLTAICQFISKHQGNILSLNEYADTFTNRFFARVEWDFDGFNLQSSEQLIDQFDQEVGNQFQMQFQFFYSNEPVRTALFVSKYSHCLEDILYRQQNGELNISIPLVISNHEDLREISERNGINFHCFPITKSNKAEQEKIQRDLLNNYSIDLVVLARYMQILSADFVSDYQNQIINIHHSFLPAFAGAKPYHAAYKRGVKIIGATAHIVTTELDEGPIICQDVIKTTHKDSIEDMVLKGKDVERSMLSQAVKLFSNHQFIVSKNKTIVFE